MGMEKCRRRFGGKSGQTMLIEDTKEETSRNRE
jgi:hypothetical protein